MTHAQFTQFEKIILRNQNELGMSVLLVLAWIAACDGRLEKSELKYLAEVATSSIEAGDVSAILIIAQDGDRASIQLAIEILRLQLDQEQYRLFLELAIGMAISDGSLTATENHVIRFISDALQLSSGSFSQIFKEVSGRPPPIPGDPSSSSHWQAGSQQGRSQRRDYSSDSSTRGSYDNTADTKTTHAYAVLGVEIGATKDDIKRAYKRLAQIHHPDRFESLGEESKRAATATFQRIREAYEHLIKNA